MKVGIALPQSDDEGTGGSWRDILALARLAEDGGVDSLWVSDHFFYRPKGGGVGSEIGSHEAWTLLTALAATTTRVELGTLVLATSFRPAGLLAKMAATADDVAAGRLILGLGCGWHEPEYEAFGYPFDHRVSRFEEALRIIVPLVRGERVTLDGTWTSVREAVILPPPVRPDLPILIAATGKRMLALTARFADQWQTAWFGLPDERYRRRHDELLGACEDEGRDPASLAVTVGVSVEERPDAAVALPLEAAAISEALGAWDQEGADHVQLAINPSTPASFDMVLSGIRAWREGSRIAAPR
ncbi:MAG TPA: LLM class flavin-dependent oxidoreductase [Candidatus Limnocylindrales bacterium]|nr:LLM class flavin-dependent oxidoreductase [Candidatus Limnocylindrales bacterium]